MDVIHSVDVNTVEVNNHRSLTKEDLWHHRFGHLSVKNLQKLARDKLVDEFDYSESLNIQFCRQELSKRKAGKNTISTAIQINSISNTAVYIQNRCPTRAVEGNN